jgi:sucrose-6-phosphate hydrolase SacC (GH32 family)
MLMIAMMAGWMGVAGGADAKPATPLTPLYQESLRPKFHITARYWDKYQLHPPNHHEGWLNDMNGLVYNQGEYHFFAQRWWTAWLHMISTDLVHWKELRPAMALEKPGDTRGVPFGGTQSGGGVVDTNNTSGLGDGKEPPMLVFWSSTDNLNQCMSYSRDRGRNWTKYEKNPVLVQAERDPNVFWYEPGKKWILIMYGPSSSGGDERKLMYGFNGENNDLHNLRECKAGEWVCSTVRMADDGRVVAMDQRGKAAGSLDVKRQNVGADCFRIGAKADGTEFLDGDIAEVVVYNRALSDEEATNVVAGLQAKWKLGEGKGEFRLPAEGLVLHLDAATIEAGGDGAVSVWKDLSGKGNDMKQATPSAMPKRADKALGDGPAVNFAGKQYLQGPAVLAAGARSFTMAAVWRRKHANDSEVICEQNTATKLMGRRASLLTVSGRTAIRNAYLLFSSTNLLQWTKLNTEIPDSFECPDMFELPVDPADSSAAIGEAGQKKWVVIDGNGDYVTGSFDGNAFTLETKKRKGDYGRHFYATMTFDNLPATDSRRIQMAWMRGWEDYPKDMPFNQQASFPCELTLRKLPQGLVLCRWPVREISRLYCGKPFSLADHTLKPDENPLTGLDGDAFDIELKLDIAKSTCSEVVLNLCGNKVTYDLKKHSLQSLDSQVPLEPRSGAIEIRVLMDRLSIETFGNHGEVSITNIAHQKPAKPALGIAAVGGEAVLTSLSVREIESMWKNFRE